MGFFSIGRISGYFPDMRYPAGYPASQIRYPAEYRIKQKPEYAAGYPVHP
jgi:hypothetical protein